jgi:tetratricopeptide (TPR) repeat protein
VNDVKGAQEDWSVAIALHPYDELVREHRADAWLEVGDLDRARNELDTLLQHDPADAMLLLKRGIVELQLGNAPAAGEWFQRAHRHAPGLALVYSLRAVSLMKQQRWKEALPLLDTALTLDPHFDLAHYDRGLVHLQLGNNAAARADMDAAILIAHDRPHVFFQRALVRKRDGDLSGARDDYDRAIELAPGYLEAQYNRAFVRKHLGDHAGAFADVERILQQTPDDPQAWTMKGNLHMLYGEYTEAIDHFDRAISLTADNANAYFNRGLAYHMTYRPQQGCDDLRRAADLGSPEAADAITYFCAF